MLFDIQLFAEEEGVTGDFATPTADSEPIDGGVTDPVEGEEPEGAPEGEPEGDAGVADQQDDGERTSKQPPEVDAAFAKLRREKEQYEKKLKELETWVKEKFGPYGIDSVEAYIEAAEKELQRQQDLYRQQQEQRLKEMGYDPQAIKEILRNDPEFQQIKQENEKVKQELQAQKAQQQVLMEFNELKTKYPQFVKEPKDIDEKTRQRWERGGVSLVEAFELANKEKILEAAAQKARNQQTNRKHLKTEGDGQSEGTDVNIPPETLQMYMDMGFSKKAAIKHYQKLYK